MPATTQRILIVDDVIDNVAVLGDTLSPQYEVQFATSGDAALQQLQGELPHLILLDIMMPGMDGHQVMAALQADTRTRAIPVIFVTAQHDAASEARALASWAVDFIHKPINPVVVRARVHLQLELIRRAEALAQSIQALRNAQAQVEDARQRELALGALMQRKLLFGAVPDGLKHFEIACHSTPCQGVAGDFYSFNRLGPQVLELVVGDVMGKGIAAAIIAAGVERTYRQVLCEQMSRLAPGCMPAVAELVNEMHRILTPELMAVESFVTLVVLRFDLAARRLEWVNAGHTTVLWAGRGGEPAVTEFLATNVPLGVLADERYEQAQAPLGAGDTVLLYSDGLSEATDAHGEAFGVGAIQALLQAHRESGAQAVLDAVCQAVARHHGRDTGRDDETAIVVRCLD